MDNLHRSAAQHVTRAHQDGIANSIGDLSGTNDVHCSATWWLRNVQLLAQGIPFFTIFSKINRAWRSSRNQIFGNQAGKLQWRLAAKADNDLWRSPT